MDVAAAGAVRPRRDAVVSRSDRQTRPANEKGPTFVGPVSGITPSAHRPDPDDPGGLGAEESGTERTGPTHENLVAFRRGRRWAEVGRHYDRANDRVTPGLWMAAAGPATKVDLPTWPLAAIPRW